jgi:hypothetical protein
MRNLFINYLSNVKHFNRTNILACLYRATKHVDLFSIKATTTMVVPGCVQLGQLNPSIRVDLEVLTSTAIS